MHPHGGYGGTGTLREATLTIFHAVRRRIRPAGVPRSQENDRPLSTTKELQSFYRVLSGGVFLCARYPCRPLDQSKTSSESNVTPSPLEAHPLGTGRSTSCAAWAGIHLPTFSLPQLSLKRRCPLYRHRNGRHGLGSFHRGTSLTRNTSLLGPYCRTIHRVLWWSWGGHMFLRSEVPLQHGSLCDTGCCLTVIK